MPSPLHDALERHDLAALAALLRAGANPDVLEPANGCRPLHSAIYELDFGGPLEALTLLLDAGANLDLRADNPGAATPLVAAIREGRRDAVTALLARGADVNLADGFGESPLRLAAAERDLELARALLHHGAIKTIDAAGGETGRTALGHAAANLDLPMVKELLRMGADPEALDIDYQKARRHVPAADAGGDAAAEALRAKISELLKPRVGDGSGP